MALSTKQFELLLTIIDNTKAFDKHDNCFQQSNREIAKTLKLSSKTTIDRLMKELRTQELVAEVIDIHGIKRVMMKPTFMWNHHKEELGFAHAMFVLGSDTAAQQWSKDCKACGYIIDPTTGECLSAYPYDTMKAYVDGYLCDDRTKYRGTNEKLVDLGDGEVAKVATLSDVSIDKLVTITFNDATVPCTVKLTQRRLREILANEYKGD